MFRRMFWFLTGAATGVWATVKVNRAARRITPESLAQAAAGRALQTGVRLAVFARDVRAGMAQRELELNDNGGLRGAQDRTARRAALDTDLPAQRRRGITYNAYDRKDEH